ncbi:hypothetical protein H6G81_04500 [Scytonema hofmannii FACHB-248]|uniref:Uncharacterized protein n=1 Tax=Scytonema hofmannii FACHB-248 TaxID=1842502 RepID=A0ABR8GK91_9CYAN|nr:MULTISPECIES: hypothetical protein [Nostocales]MBD2603810.1 hypothetical protein [Scytonema hofmannii FACHB-248]
MKKLKAILLACAFSSLTTTAIVLSPLRTLAQTPALRVIGQEEAAASTTNLQVWAGRSTAIDFSQTNEVITYILIADPSRTVYNTDAELSSNQAKTVFVKVIKPLRFPGATSAVITNLSIKTRTPNGQQHLYTFNIVPGFGTPTYSGISISAITPEVEQTGLVGSNQIATLNDIERGLKIAIALGYTATDDPVVFKVREFLALVRNRTPISKAAASVKLPLSVVSSLRQLGLEKFKFKLPQTPLNPNPANSNSAEFTFDFGG